MPSTTKPRVSPASRSVATSPAARLPKRKLAPTTTAAACSAPTSTRSMNSSGVQAAISRSNGSTSTASTPASAEQLGRRLDRVRVGRRVLGAQHRHRVRVEGDGHDASALPASAASARGLRITCWWPRWTPSKLPIMTTVRPRSAGTSSKERPDLHGRSLPSGSADEDGHGARAPVAPSARTAPGTRRRARTPRARRARQRQVERSADPDVGGLVLVEVDAGKRRPGRVGDRDQRRTPRRAPRGCAPGRGRSAPTAVRRSAVRCPPTPSAAPRSRAIARM